MTIFDIASVVNLLYTQAFTISNIKSGFVASGIEPFNCNIIADEDFLASQVTDQPEPLLATTDPTVNVPASPSSSGLGLIPVSIKPIGDHPANSSPEGIEPFHQR